MIVVAALVAGCGQSAHHTTRHGRPRTAIPAEASTSPRNEPLAPVPSSAPAFGLTEDNAQLLERPSPGAASAVPASVGRARERLTALHPDYLRLFIDWAALQPTASQPPDLEASVDGCARTTAPCVPFGGIAAELAAIAGQQRAAAAAAGEAGFQVELDIVGTPAWAAEPAGGCLGGGTEPGERPVGAAALPAYKALIADLLALGAREGVSLPWWSPWNEPDDPLFIDPQRASCSVSSPSLAASDYARLAAAMSEELAAHGEGARMVLGELADYPSGSAHRTGLAEFVAALPGSTLCEAGAWSVHDYPVWGAGARPEPEGVQELEEALTARGGCAARAPIWVTETGAGAREPGAARSGSSEEAEAGCDALAALVAGWSARPRVQAIFQYTYRDDPDYPVGLSSADLGSLYPAYNLWLAYGGARRAGRPVSATSLSAACH